MTTTIIIIITFCSLLLVAYVFDLTSSKTKIPSVILLLLLGWIARQLTQFFEIKLPDFTSILPVLGTVGLILIVLEGALELELNKSKITLIKKSLLGSILPVFAMAFLLAFLFQYFGSGLFKDNLTNAIPFCVISSAIAITSTRNLTKSDKEFIIYESSFSDILGVIFFNFIALNNVFNFHSFAHFGLQIVSIAVISFIATIGLSLLLSKIEHNIKFVPIILLVILIYTFSHVYHLPALIFILLFGLFLGNLDEMKRFKWIERFKPHELDKEVLKFKELTIEASFLLRSLFFLLFGFLIETREILNPETLIWTFVIVGIILFFRAIQLWLSQLPFMPLFFIAPRGLVTILLFLSITPEKQILLVNKSLIIQVILLTAVIMMIGLMFTKKNKVAEIHPKKEDIADELQK
ncbi:MAG: sodium:proton antiporter [Bacteroidota bacterium]|nr:sodium:proton antiporter [Bacteroidota bacterium]